MKHTYGILFSTSLLLTILISCIKEEVRPVAPLVPKKGEVRGVVYYQNRFAEDSSKVYPLSDKDIFLQNIEDKGTLRNLLIVRTDANGRFTLTSLDTAKQYNLAVRSAVSANGVDIVVSADKEFSGRDTTVVVTAQVDEKNQHGILITTVDSLGGRIPSAPLIVYGSKVLAQADTGFTGQNAIAKIITNYHGDYLLLGVPTDSVYIKGRIQVTDSFEIATGIVPEIVLSDTIRRVKVRFY